MRSARPVFTSNKPPPSRMAGLTLVESLIAVLVFSFGAIGLAGLQNVSMQSGYEAIQRTQAVYLANDILERIRSNAAQIDAYDNDGGGADTTWRIIGGGTRAQPEKNCRTTSCTEAELAAFDLWDWEQSMDGNAVKQQDVDVGGLASPTGCIRQTANGRIEVAIAWLGREALTNPNLATGCTVNDGRYGNHDKFRRVLLVRTFIQDI